MRILIRAFAPDDEHQVVALWQAAELVRPWNDPHADIARKLTVQPEHFLVATDGDAVIGTTMAGFDGHRGWLYYVATSPKRRGEGIAKALISRAESLLIAMGCPKVQLMVRDGNDGVMSFYESIGYKRFAVGNAGKRLIADN